MADPAETPKAPEAPAPVDSEGAAAAGRQEPGTAAAPEGGPLGFIAQAWLVIVLGVVFGSGLAGIDHVLGPKIAANQLDETLSQVPRLVPGAAREATEPVALVAQGEQRTVYRAVGEGGAHRGWVLPARGQGFADVIRVLIGLDPEARTITGLFVLEQKETPGLGDNITKDAFLGQFGDKRVGADAQDLVVRKGARTAPQHIQPVTGATISSQSVCDIVNAAVKRWGPALRAAR